MKKIFVLFISAIIFFGCGQKKEEEKPTTEITKNKYEFDSSDIKTTPVENVNGSFLMKYKFEKGKTYNYRMTAISEDNQTIHTMDTVLNQNVNQNITYLISFEPKEIDSDSVTELSCSVTSVKLDADANGQKFNYESGTSMDSASQNRYAQYASLIDNPFGIRVNKYGEVLEIFRVDKIVNKFLTIKGYADSVSSAEKEGLRKDMSEGALKPLVTQLIRKFPDHPVGKDSTWSVVQQPMPFMIFTLNNTNTYKIINLEKLNDSKLAVIDAGMNSKVTGKTTATERGVDYTFKKPTAVGSGKIYFNINDGLMQKAKTYTEMNVEFSMEMNSPKGKQKGSRSEKVKNTYIVERL